MGVVREGFRKDKGGVARRANYGSPYDDLVLRRHLRPSLAARRAHYGSPYGNTRRRGSRR